ncbi:MAG: siderophore-interacting protein [Nocardioides sp.]|nr:siderophore-interacting protein [Nocardioides sp.]
MTAARRLGPGMARITFSGPDLRDYPTTDRGDEYVRLFFHEGNEARLPVVVERGWQFTDGIEPAPARVYTIRKYSPGEIEIDFVVHEGGIGAAWAMQAQPGQVLGINAPHGLYERPPAAVRQVLVADEPGLPAALRIAEQTADQVPTTLVLEVRGHAHRLFADVERGRVDYVWLCGTGNGQTPSQLGEVLRRQSIDQGTYVWVATEGRLNRAIRKYLRHELKLPASHYKCVAYWQEKAEVWNARYEELGTDFQDKLSALWADRERDSEEIIDEVQRLYEVAGL